MQMIRQSIKSEKIVKDEEEILELGMIKIDKPLLIANSIISSTRKHIYEKCKLPAKFDGINLPIILNGELIPLKDDYMLEKVDFTKISTASFDKNIKKYQSFDTPMGVIYLSSRK